MTDTVQQLREARALVKAGWIKGESVAYSPIGHRLMVCAWGALNRVGADFLTHMMVGNHLADVLGKPRYYSILALNDRFWTRKGQVLRAFDRAIAEAEKMAETRQVITNVNTGSPEEVINYLDRQALQSTKYKEMASL